MVLWFLCYIILHKNASQISQTDWSDFVFSNSKVFNLKSLSKICSANNSFFAFESVVKKNTIGLFMGVSEKSWPRWYSEGSYTDYLYSYSHGKQNKYNITKENIHIHMYIYKV